MLYSNRDTSALFRVRICHNQYKKYFHILDIYIQLFRCLSLIRNRNSLYVKKKMKFPIINESEIENRKENQLLSQAYIIIHGRLIGSYLFKHRYWKQMMV